MPHDMRGAAYRAFADAYQVLYVADATRRAWRPVETKRNFKVIRHGIPEKRLAEEVSRWNRVDARKKLGVPANATVLSVVGTVCRRKGQLDLVQAYKLIPDDLKTNTFVFIAGKLAEDEYVEELRDAVGQDEAKIVLTDHIEDPFLYYAASDVSICTSRVESAPRIIVEAMACGLPIITTPVFGIPELVRRNINALYYEPGDPEELALAIGKLLEDDVLRRRLGANSLQVLAGQPGFAEMVEGYARSIRQAANLKLVRHTLGGARSTHSTVDDTSQTQELVDIIGK